MLTLSSSPFSALSVMFRTAILDPLRAPVWSPWSRNLISDTGLDFPAEFTFRDCFRRFAVGTGTRPTKRDSGTITATRTGATVTASAGFFVAADIGRILKFDTGAEFVVLNIPDETHATVVATGADAAGEFTIWYTTDDTLEAEVATFLSGVTGISVAGDVLTYTRVGTSAKFGETKLLREVGWRPDTGQNKIFGRALIPAGGDLVLAGQMYKIEVKLSVRVGPSTVQATANVGTGCDTAGSHSLSAWCLDASGASTGGLAVLQGAGASDGAGALDAVTQQKEMAFTGSATAPQNLVLGTRYVNDCIFPAYTRANPANYVAGSRTRTFSLFIPTGQAAASVTGLRVGEYQTAETYRHKFTTPFAKTALQELTGIFRVSWGRVLVN